MTPNTIYRQNPTTGLYELNPDFDPAAFRAAHPDPVPSPSPRRYRSDFDDPDRDAPCLLDEIAALRRESSVDEIAFTDPSARCATCQDTGCVDQRGEDGLYDLYTCSCERGEAKRAERPWMRRVAA